MESYIFVQTIGLMSTKKMNRFLETMGIEEQEVITRMGVMSVADLMRMYEAFIAKDGGYKIERVINQARISHLHYETKLHRKKDQMAADIGEQMLDNGMISFHILKEDNYVDIEAVAMVAAEEKSPEVVKREVSIPESQE